MSARQHLARRAPPQHRDAITARIHVHHLTCRFWKREEAAPPVAQASTTQGARPVSVQPPRNSMALLPVSLAPPAPRHPCHTRTARTHLHTPPPLPGCVTTRTGRLLGERFGGRV